MFVQNCFSAGIKARVHEVEFEGKSHGLNENVFGNEGGWMRV